MDDKKLITYSYPKSYISEDYKKLRTNIKFAKYDRELKMILFTSSGASEGKTTVSSNLAVVMAKANDKVLLIDCDLRKPNIHKIFEVPNEIGLSDALQAFNQNNSQSIEKYMVRSGIDNLDIITAGSISTNPSELLSTNAKYILAFLKDKYDYILIDTPPINVVTDAAVLSSICDGVVIIAVPEKTKIKSLQKTKEQLVRVGANILGVVFNNVKQKEITDGYYGYY